MVRQSSKTDKNASASVVAEPAQAVAEPVQAVAPKKSSKKDKAAAISAAPAPAPVAVPTPAPVVEAAPAVDAAPVAEASVETSSSKLNEINAKIQQITSTLTTLKGDVKSLEKIIAREQRQAQRSSKSTKKVSGNRQPSGFVKPTRISDELAQFLGKTSGTEMARTEVSREINKYIKAHGLQLPTNRRIITPDTKLSSLLNLSSSDDQLTYFNLQKYMKPHFIKAVVVATA